LWPIDENLRKIAHYMEMGYRATKLSPDFCKLMPGSTKEAVRRLDWVQFPHSHILKEMMSGFAKIRKEFGELDIMVDGHQGVERQPIAVTEALEYAEALAEFRIRFYEEPLAFTNLEGYRHLRKHSRIPLAAGENFNGLDQFHHWISSGALHVVQPDVGLVGGIHEAVRVIEHAHAFHITTAIHTGGSMGPSFAASWHIAAACSSVEWLERVPAARSIQDDLLTDRFELRDGCVGLPTSPGLGVTLTAEHLEKYRFVPGAGERT
jgi:L-alanine-DL-glutamate epimerase-like enolase superfamily enzyme